MFSVVTRLDFSLIIKTNKFILVIKLLMLILLITNKFQVNGIH